MPGTYWYHPPVGVQLDRGLYGPLIVEDPAEPAAYDHDWTGQRVRVVFANTTTMYHPMHIHGHTFQLSPAGPRKDTVIVRPGQQVACDFDASNPGEWMTHCHNLYHAPQGGMMAMLSYQA